MRKYAVVFLAWGEKFIEEVKLCISRSRQLHGLDFILITDTETKTASCESIFSQIIRANFATEGLLRKAEMVKFLPAEYDAFLFLDSDITVIQDVNFAFSKALKFGIAASPAPHYSLDCFFNFDRLMTAEGIPCKGQLQYNTGVIFFQNSKPVKQVFLKWLELASKYKNVFKNDQPFFTLAMELLDFNPYTLSISYNYRGFGDVISGPVRIWHNHEQPPANINEYKQPWPRRAWSKLVLNHNNP